MINKKKKIFQCPQCSSEKIKFGIDSIICQSCGSVYTINESQIDFRLQKEKIVDASFQLGGNFLIDKSFDCLKVKENAEVSFNYNDIPSHLSKALLSYFPKSNNEESIALDLGCGKECIHKNIIKQAGYNYIGFDFESKSADILGDAHALPFKDNSFDFVLSMAVLEHIKFPFIFSKEINRVLKPNGTLIGSVAFLEGFHSHSYYHHTHYGTYNTLDNAGFKNIIVAPNPDWDVLKAQSSFLFPRLPKMIARLIISPIRILSRLWFMLLSIIRRKNYKKSRILMQSASFYFIAKK